MRTRLLLLIIIYFSVDYETYGVIDEVIMWSIDVRAMLTIFYHMHHCYHAATGDMVVFHRDKMK